MYVCMHVCVLYLVRVPQADCAAQRQLPHQQVVHPAEGELQVLHLTLLEVQVYVLWKREHVTQITIFTSEMLKKKTHPSYADL